MTHSRSTSKLAYLMVRKASSASYFNHAFLSRFICTHQVTVPVKALSRTSRNFSTGLPLNTYSLITSNESKGLQTITLSDKKTRNALSLQMMQELISAITTSQSDANVRCIVLKGSPETPVFSSGHNLKELTKENGNANQKHIFATCTDLMLSIRNAEVPVIAAVNGLAAAAGCQLVAACDFAVVTEKSSFSTPGATFGLFCSTPGVAVSRAVNKNTAAFMLLSGQTITASEALNAGLVAKVVPEDNLDQSIDKIYESIQSKSRSVISFGKKFFYEQLEMPYEKALREGENAMVSNLQLNDSQEGLQSFKEKRHPVWTHGKNLVRD